MYVYTYRDIYTYIYKHKFMRPLCMSLNCTAMQASIVLLNIKFYFTSTYISD